MVWLLLRLPRSEGSGEEGGFAIEVGREGGREGGREVEREGVLGLVSIRATQK